MTDLVFACVTCEARVATASEAREHEVDRHGGLTASYAVMNVDDAHWYGTSVLDQEER